MSIDDFKILKSFGIGTYQCFQETYHYDTYLKMHPTGPKHDYSWHVHAMNRALEAGIDDVGIGALFGLTDYKFETLAMLNHAFYLDENMELVLILFRYLELNQHSMCRFQIIRLMQLTIFHLKN